MAILIDPPLWPAHGTVWSHLVSDRSYDELHEFARAMPLPRRGFDLDHYDVPASLHARAVELGANPVDPREVVRGLERSGLRVRQADRAAARPLRRRAFLLEHWAALADSTGISSARAVRAHWAQLGEQLIARWNEPHRRYHDERHLEDVLLALDHLSVRGETVGAAVALAAWFHDAVYRGTVTSAGGAESDEIASARLAALKLAELGAAPATVELVEALVAATDPGLIHASPEVPFTQLLNADLAIFAGGAERYGQYAAAVRAEYAHVPDTDFRVGRAAILRGYLDRPSIYLTATARELWEAGARRNLLGEVALLDGFL